MKPRSMLSILRETGCPTVRSSTQPARPLMGWTIVAVHESKESWEQFRDGTLMPRMQQGIEGGFTAPPDEAAAFDVQNLQP